MNYIIGQAHKAYSKMDQIVMKMAHTPDSKPVKVEFKFSEEGFDDPQAESNSAFQTKLKNWMLPFSNAYAKFKNFIGSSWEFMKTKASKFSTVIGNSISSGWSRMFGSKGRSANTDPKEEVLATTGEQIATNKKDVLPTGLGAQTNEEVNQMAANEDVAPTGPGADESQQVEVPVANQDQQIKSPEVEETKRDENSLATQKGDISANRDFQTFTSPSSSRSSGEQTIGGFDNTHGSPFAGSAAGSLTSSAERPIGGFSTQIHGANPAIGGN